MPPGKRCDRAEVDDAHLVVGQQHEVSGMRVAVHHLQPPRRVVGELEQPGAHQVSLFLRALADDHRHRDAFDPFRDDHLRRAGDDRGTTKWG